LLLLLLLLLLLHRLGIHNLVRHIAQGKGVVTRWPFTGPRQRRRRRPEGVRRFLFGTRGREPFTVFPEHLGFC